MKQLQYFIVVAGVCLVSLAVTVTFFFFYPLSLFLIGTGLTGWTIWEIWKGRASRHWPHTPGVILSSSWERKYTHIVTDARPFGAVRFGYLVPKVSYSYDVNDLRYVGHRPYYCTDYTRPRFDTVAFAKDKTVPVYFNPNNPGESVLVPGCRLFPIIIAFPFGLVMAIGALGEYDYSQWKHETFLWAKDAALLLAIVAFLCWRNWTRRKPAQPIVPADGPAPRGRG